jgi:CheY-like chemotaxis protein
MDKPFALIVEDNYEIVTLFQHVLDMAGYHTDIVLDGSEAMQRIEADPPDIVLLDLQLPGMSGADILQQMRTNQRLIHIPVVVVTAYADTKLPYEPDLRLLKPVNIRQLSNLIQKLRSTHGAGGGLAHDPITGLYTPAVFAERLTGSIQRVGQASLLRFGVLFADLRGMELLKVKLDSRGVNAMLRRLADELRGVLRPMDTVAWSPPEGTFLALLDEVPPARGALRIAERVQAGLLAHLATETEAPGLGTQFGTVCGVLLCDAQYRNVEQVMKDLTRARSQLKKGTHPSPAVFDHNAVVTQE